MDNALPAVFGKTVILALLRACGIYLVIGSAGAVVYGISTNVTESLQFDPEVFIRVPLFIPVFHVGVFLLGFWAIPTAVIGLFLTFSKAWFVLLKGDEWNQWVQVWFGSFVACCAYVEDRFWLWGLGALVGYVLFDTAVWKKFQLVKHNEDDDLPEWAVNYKYNLEKWEKLVKTDRETLFAELRKKGWSERESCQRKGRTLFYFRRKDRVLVVSIDSKKRVYLAGNENETEHFLNLFSSIEWAKEGQ